MSLALHYVLPFDNYAQADIFENLSKTFLKLNFSFPV